MFLNYSLVLSNALYKVQYQKLVSLEITEA